MNKRVVMTRDWERVGTWLFGYRWMLAELVSGEIIARITNYSGVYQAFLADCKIGEYLELDDAQRAVINEIKKG